MSLLRNLRLQEAQDGSWAIFDADDLLATRDDADDALTFLEEYLYVRRWALPEAVPA